MEYKKYPERVFRHLLSMPVVYFMIFPLVIFDLCLEMYHQICFRLYKIPIIMRSQYIKIDRHKLQYLIWYEKIYCAYCGYANGLAHYFTVIAAETEKYWCGIKHAKDPNFIPPEHHQDFLEYGDAKAYRKLK
ncbi:MAG: hypothetical protein NTX00_01150 [Candidatus Parcubacteria bacterium]|nr:hypothetical protein [Candidatus Parcubacteria bacterium]